MDEIKVVIRYKAKPGMDDRAKNELRELVALVVAKEEDCRGIEILQDTSEPVQFLLYETWTSKEAYLGDHMTTSYILSFRERALDVFAGPPEITYWTSVS